MSQSSSSSLHWQHAQSALNGNDVSRSFLLYNCSVRRTIKSWIVACLVVLVSSGVVVFVGCVVCLQDSIKIRLTAEIAKIIYDCDDDCRRENTAEVGDFFEIVLCSLVGTCAFAIPLDVVIFILLGMHQYNHGAWYSWILFHYIVMMVLVFTIFLCPISFGLFKLIQHMKMYALTFESRVPFN